MLRFHRMAAEPEQIIRALGRGARSSNEMVRSLREAGLRAREVSVGVQRLVSASLPAIALRDDGSCVLLAKAAADRVLIFDSATQQSRILPTTEFAAHWTGQLILATRGTALGELGRRFDITWFRGAVHKYRWILGEMLAASLFLQIFALLSPLFFQVVIDKVLMHRGIAVTAEIKTGGRSVISYLLSPLRRYAHEGIRER